MSTPADLDSEAERLADTPGRIGRGPGRRRARRPPGGSPAIRFPDCLRMGALPDQARQHPATVQAGNRGIAARFKYRVVRRSARRSNALTVTDRSVHLPGEGSPPNSNTHSGATSKILYSSLSVFTGLIVIGEDRGSNGAGNRHRAGVRGQRGGLSPRPRHCRKSRRNPDGAQPAESAIVVPVECPRHGGPFCRPFRPKVEIQSQAPSVARNQLPFATAKKFYRISREKTLCF